MGNDPGPLDRKEHATVVLKMTGPVTADVAQEFKNALVALVKKFKPKMGGLTRPLKARGRAKRRKKP
jgi:hypothetical protein